jgi:hypothetical protein
MLSSEVCFCQPAKAASRRDNGQRVLLQVVWYAHQCSTASTGKEVQSWLCSYLSDVDVGQ